MPWNIRAYRLGALLAVAAALGACDSDSDSTSSDRASGVDDEGATGSPASAARDAGIRAATGQNAGESAPPPEVEVPLSFEAPQAGQSALYVPNPTTNRVAVVNASTFAIESLAVGSQPTYAATVPGQDVALVLNVGSRDAALLRTEQGVTRALKLAVGHDANAIAIAPGGLHAVIFFDGNARASTAQSFQDLTVVDLTRGAEQARRVSVGFRPRAVQFSADGARAFVITEDGISILDFAALAGGPTIARLVPLGDVVGGAQSVDVQVTPDGRFALARREGDSTLRLITLADGSVETLALASLPGLPSAVAGAPSDEGLTDLDLAPDGRFALAVLRGRRAIVRIPLPEGFRDPSAPRVRVVADQLIGSLTLSRSGKRAVAYTTAAPVESLVLIDDIESDAPSRSVILRKSVRAVALSDDGTRALVLHAAVPTGQAAQDDDARIDASEGYSVVDTTSGFVKLQLTSARLKERDLLITPDRARLFALQRDDAKNVRAVAIVDLGSFQISDLTLSKPPTSLGFLPGLARVFVGQVGDGGLITFLDAGSGARLRDVSGFEIAGRIRL